MILTIGILIVLIAAFRHGTHKGLAADLYQASWLCSSRRSGTLLCT